MVVVVVRSSAARTNCDHIDYIDGGGNDVDDVINHDVALQSSFENLEKIGVTLAAELRILTPYRVECIDKTLIFGLDTAIDR